MNKACQVALVHWTTETICNASKNQLKFAFNLNTQYLNVVSKKNTKVYKLVKLSQGQKLTIRIPNFLHRGHYLQKLDRGVPFKVKHTYLYCLPCEFTLEKVYFVFKSMTRLNSGPYFEQIWLFSTALDVFYFFQC